MQDGYKIDQDIGVKELRLWSRTWNHSFSVDVEWKPSDETELHGRVACGWTEYESASIGASTGGKIPAFEEVLTWLPRWAVATKIDDGLFEVAKTFSV
jgi:hypothetical protein